jgi:hypothetical protein
MINEETTLFIEAISDFLETRIKELTAICKTNIEETINAKIQGFYKKSSAVSYDDVLFDLDGTQILVDCVKFLEKQIELYCNVWSKEKLLDNNRIIAKLSSVTDKRCFALGRIGLAPTCYKRMICVYKHFMIELRQNECRDYYRYQQPEFYYETIEHILSNDILFAFKHFQTGYNGGICTTTLMNSPEWKPIAYDHHNQPNPNNWDTYRGLKQIMDIYNKHPEYFQQQCNEFELFCKKEYEEINNTKEQLKATISLYEDKLSKYTDFEESKQLLEDDLTFCRLEKSRLDNETLQLKIMKTTLDNEYHELELDKMELLKEKLRLKEETKSILEEEKQELETIKETLHDEYHELEIEKIKIQKEQIKSEEETVKLRIEQRKIAKTQASLATIQLSIDDASKALEKEINDLTYAKFIFEKEKEEYQKSVVIADLV